MKSYTITAEEPFRKVEIPSFDGEVTVRCKLTQPENVEAAGTTYPIATLGKGVRMANWLRAVLAGNAESAPKAKGWQIFQAFLRGQKLHGEPDGHGGKQKLYPNFETGSFGGLPIEFSFTFDGDEVFVTADGKKFTSKTYLRHEDGDPLLLVLGCPLGIDNEPLIGARVEYEVTTATT